MDNDADVDAGAIAFGTDGWRATLDVFTKPRVRMVGQAVATTLDERGATGTVVIGYDARETSPGFADELAHVLRANGFDVLLPDRDTPTPIVAWTVKDRDLAGALQITASHNPPEYNGVKVILGDGAPALPDWTAAFEENLAVLDPLPEDEWGERTEEDLIGPFHDHALDYVDTDLEGLPVAYDALYGSGRGVTDELLEAAGADVTRLNCVQDPDFGGGSPEPSAENADGLVEEVSHGDAALGIINDGDADRIGVVTPDRGYLDPNLFFAAMYDFLLEDGTGDVVRTVSTSSIVDRVAEAHGESVHEVAVGFKWVAQAMVDHDALLGGEESGGYGVTRHLRNKDGVYVALLAAAVHAAESYDDRLTDLRERYGEIHQDRVSVDCPDGEKERVLADLEAALPGTVAGATVDRVSDVDGFKVFLDDGTWLLIRQSGTEPKLRVYAEAADEARVDALLDAGRELVEPLV
jgi:phosphomannomutase